MKMDASNVRRTLKQIKARGGNTDCDFKSGKVATAVTPTNVRAVKEMVRKNPVRNLQDIMEKCNVSKTSASRSRRCAASSANAWTKSWPQTANTSSQKPLFFSFVYVINFFCLFYPFLWSRVIWIKWHQPYCS